MKRGLIGLVVVGAVLALVFGLSGSSTPTHSASRPSTKTATSSTSSPAATSTTVAGTPTTAPVSHTAAAPVCPPATQKGAAKRLIAFTKAPPDCIPKTGVYDAKVVTNAGTFVIRMDAASSYAAVNNFVFLARYHFFNGIIFQRVIKGFVIQGGDPTGTGAGGPGYSFTGNEPPKACEAKKDCYPVYSVAMANSGTPSSDGSQFFIVLPGGQTILDQEPVYTLFGQVISGRSVINKIGAAGAPETSATGTPSIVYHMDSVTISTAS